MILSTLKELDEVTTNNEKQPPHAKDTLSEEVFEPEPLLNMTEEVTALKTYDATYHDDETEEQACPESQKQFYLSLRERILVLFEGFQSPNNKNIEAKIDLTLNFLEYLLATIDEQLEHLDRSKR